MTKYIFPTLYTSLLALICWPVGLYTFSAAAAGLENGWGWVAIAPVYGVGVLLMTVPFAWGGKLFYEVRNSNTGANESEAEDA